MQASLKFVSGCQVICPQYDVDQFNSKKVISAFLFIINQLIEEIVRRKLRDNSSGKTSTGPSNELVHVRNFFFWIAELLAAAATKILSKIVIKLKWCIVPCLDARIIIRKQRNRVKSFITFLNFQKMLAFVANGYNDAVDRINLMRTPHAFVPIIFALTIILWNINCLIIHRSRNCWNRMLCLHAICQRWLLPKLVEIQCIEWPIKSVLRNFIYKHIPKSRSFIRKYPWTEMIVCWELESSASNTNPQRMILCISISKVIIYSLQFTVYYIQFQWCVCKQKALMQIWKMDTFVNVKQFCLRWKIWMRWNFISCNIFFHRS